MLLDLRARCVSWCLRIHVRVLKYVALCASRTEWEDRPCSGEIPAPLLGGGLLRELDSVSLLRSNPSNHEMARGIIVNRRHTLLDVDLSSPDLVQAKVGRGRDNFSRWLTEP